MPGGTADAMAASTAAVPEPAKSTAVKSEPAPASATSRSRQRRIISKHSGSRWQRSSMTSACLTLAVVFAGPGIEQDPHVPGSEYTMTDRDRRRACDGVRDLHGVLAPVTGMDHATAFDEAMVEMTAPRRSATTPSGSPRSTSRRDRSVLASPLRDRGRHRRAHAQVKIGMAVSVLPLAHPLHLAEDAATVDQLSHGRLDFGVGTQRAARALHRLRHPVRREPGPLLRDPRHREEGVDRGPLLVLGASTSSSRTSP